jgi:alpha-1,2-mannosyltransferase
MENKIKLFLLAILLISIVILGKVFLQSSYIDFRVYYEAAMKTRTTGNPYSSQNPHMSYLYPPMTVLFFLPFTVVQISSAEKIWLGISLILYGFSLFLLYRTLSISWKSYEGSIYLICCMVFFPLKFTLGMGQINILILFFIVLFLCFYEKRKSLSGIALSLAIIAKISPIIFLGYILYKKDWDLFYLVIVILLGSGVLSLVVFPVPTEIYFNSILPSLTHAWPTAYYNQSITGFLRRLPFSLGVVTQVKWLFICFTVTITAYILNRRTQSSFELIKLSSIIPLILIISSFSWQHHFVLLIPAYLILSHFILVNDHDVRKKSILLFFVMISYLLVGYNIKHLKIVPIILQSHVFYGTVLLWALYMYVINKEI